MRIGGAYALIEQTATRDDYMEGLKLTDAEYQVVVSLRRHPILTKASRSVRKSNEYVCTSAPKECHAARLTPLVGGRVGCQQWPGRGVHVADTMVARGRHLSDLSA
ncbi:hypothetical protein HZS93_04726 [Xanthomonas citri]|nr:hypothetical protein HZS93_04726 [Xanthomonas citri]CEE62768.1 hypothetical protein XAC71A_640002 [Xanthomonas citri pv. citri]CEE72022.1 hypothetical protein XACS584_800062 [Xanthomonas citri pv. citri]CEE88450.1 hypothetical protein XACLE20_980087 [Xanthomonas citri pv. citri]CEH44735.1 hypothetical protein XACLE3_4690008 [Xanthomonas citri pv. citri]